MLTPAERERIYRTAVEQLQRERTQRALRIVDEHYDRMQVIWDDLDKQIHQVNAHASQK